MLLAASHDVPASPAVSSLVATTKVAANAAMADAENGRDEIA